LYFHFTFLPIDISNIIGCIIESKPRVINRKPSVIASLTDGFRLNFLYFRVISFTLPV